MTHKTNIELIALTFLTVIITTNQWHLLKNYVKNTAHNCNNEQHTAEPNNSMITQGGQIIQENIAMQINQIKKND